MSSTTSGASARSFASPWSSSTSSRRSPTGLSRISREAHPGKRVSELPDARAGDCPGPSVQPTRDIRQDRRTRAHSRTCRKVPGRGSGVESAVQGPGRRRSRRHHPPRALRVAVSRPIDGSFPDSPHDDTVVSAFLARCEAALEAHHKRQIDRLVATGLTAAHEVEARFERSLRRSAALPVLPKTSPRNTFRKVPTLRWSEPGGDAAARACSTSRATVICPSSLFPAC